MYDPWLHVVLYQPEIPHNTGSVGRTCVAVGAKLWLVRPLGFRIDDYYLRRSGLDYWEHLVWEAVDDWQQLVERLPAAKPLATAKERAQKPWLFTKKGTQLYSDVRYSDGDVLVFGRESQGLPDWMLEADAERQLRIPTRPEARSLNLSNSVAIAVYEALRQKGQ